MPWQKQWPVELIVEEMLDFPLAVNWAAALLGGRGFGTGNYSMYGAFVADLVLETITDDPLDLPVVHNVEIDGVECAPNRFALAMKRYKSANLRDPPVSSYRTGDRVVHTDVGSGTVVHVDRNVLTVAFDSGKTVRMVDSFVDRE